MASMALLSVAFAALLSASSFSLSLGAEVSYEGLGSFEYTLFSLHHRKPNPPEQINTRIRLYTRPHGSVPQELDRLEPATISSSNFDASWNTKILVHGWTESGTEEDWIEMKDKYLEHNDLNVIIVDWEEAAGNLDYAQSRADIRVVGRQVAELIISLHDSEGVLYEDFHIIGFSLGAHLAGYAGEWLYERVTAKPARITGLDPAGPEFGGENVDPKYRLDKTDASFVDVVHTDCDFPWDLYFGGLGLYPQLGHLDFYPNGGRKMPGCSFLNPACDHIRAVEYFKESINPEHHFQCIRRASTWEDVRDDDCENNILCTDSNPCSEMGERAAQINNFEGALYLQTNENTPYAQN